MFRYVHVLMYNHFSVPVFSLHVMLFSSARLDGMYSYLLLHACAYVRKEKPASLRSSPPHPFFFRFLLSGYVMRSGTVEAHDRESHETAKREELSRASVHSSAYPSSWCLWYGKHVSVCERRPTTLLPSPSRR